MKNNNFDKISKQEKIYNNKESDQRRRQIYKSINTGFEILSVNINNIEYFRK